ncbi:MAG: 30S ribosomal protein S1 [Planctomycetota bacterium]|jgi:small subunit ribosomal protein S1|nr:30S ribosomal protein S1 [Planctomycetota bacterium]
MNIVARAKRITAVDDQLLATEMEAAGVAEAEALLTEGTDARDQFAVRSIVTGFAVADLGDEVVVDIGYKSEGYVSRAEFGEGDQIEVGSKVQVMILDIEDNGELILSKRQADLELGWQEVLGTNKEGDRVSGRVVRKIKGGLLVDIGVPVFLPASQIDIRRATDVGEYIGQDIDAEIIKIDAERKNIVVSRRKVLEEERKKNREELVRDLQVGDLRQGIVKNITDFGAFIDLGGLDGLLHITDMSWGRVNHPSEIVSLSQSIEIVVLDYDAERNRISLGLKQKTRNPWEVIEERYPAKSFHHGEVVNLMNYGAFVKLEDGIEGLVHISEMTWGKAPTHPNEAVKIGQPVTVMVLEINHDKQEISLGMKQAEKNPWDDISDRYPLATTVKGAVTSIANYGAFVQLEEGVEGLLHVNDISWTKKLTHPSPEVNKGDELECMVLGIDQERQRISLSLKHLKDDPWESEIPEKLKRGDVIDGKVSKITNFGVFVEILDGLEGLLHVSELPEEAADDPTKVLTEGQDIKVKVINVDGEERKIGLSMKDV